MALICPFVRFSLRVPIAVDNRFGPRFCYVPSLYFIESGSAKVVYDDGSYVQLKTGALYFLQPGIRHKWVINEGDPFAFRCVFFEWSYRPKPQARVSIDLLCLRPEDYDDGLLDEPLEMGIPEQLMVDSFPFWKGLFESVTTDVKVLDEEDYPGLLAVNGHFLVLLHHVFQLARRQSEPKDPRIAKLLALMEQKSGGEYGDVEHWAEKLGLSRSYFHTLFRAQTGLTPARYWNQCRIKKAQNDLLETNDSVTKIAERFGFSSLYVFTRLFHQMVGVTPTDYRQQSRLNL
ncbi:helix-turn-helix domain-containing protein [Cohnella silvisoli]|uniref:AraC family transcriptional regulator n=1 Tax=Cohnella silvisoli TaxID=2873699 RepID=A0ABV1L2I0_9BACL|nr:AraC family transcriptional regulator [Cohnella silvisoli]MCD9025396.1 AraC family transcriptional regulator [Cohnella silvisoli]